MRHTGRLTSLGIAFLLSVDATEAAAQSRPLPAFRSPGRITRPAVLATGLPGNVIKTVTDLNGGGVVPGDTLVYNVSLTNVGGPDDALQLALLDTIPANTTYVPGSLAITSGANAGAKTDPSGDDQAQYEPVQNRVRFRLGAGATATSNGTLPPGASTSVEFRVVVGAAAAPRVVAVGQGASGGRHYIATRAAEWLALAEKAYERNDRGAFPEDMLVLAERDIKLLEAGPNVAVERLHSNVLFPSDVRLFDADTWGRALSLRSEADRVGAPDEIARAEALLIRQGNPILAGPACLADSQASRRAGAILSAVERARVNPTPLPPPDTAKQVVTDRPAPVPQPDSARLPRPRGACEAPERLSGVPNSVHFALDTSSLAFASREVLDRAIAKLRDYPGVRVRLSGHTDPRASNAYNLALSQRRVGAVTAYLGANGIGANRILAATALGEERLWARAIDARNTARNRRVDITYTLCDGSELVPDETLDDLQLETVRRREREK